MAVLYQPLQAEIRVHSFSASLLSPPGPFPPQPPYTLPFPCPIPPAPCLYGISPQPHSYSPCPSTSLSQVKFSAGPSCHCFHSPTPYSPLRTWRLQSGFCTGLQCSGTNVTPMTSTSLKRIENFQSSSNLSSQKNSPSFLNILFP